MATHRQIEKHSAYNASSYIELVSHGVAPCRMKYKSPDIHIYIYIPHTAHISRANEGDNERERETGERSTSGAHLRETFKEARASG